MFVFFPTQKLIQKYVKRDILCLKSTISNLPIFRFHTELLLLLLLSRRETQGQENKQRNRECVSKKYIEDDFADLA